MPLAVVVLPTSRAGLASSRVMACGSRRKEEEHPQGLLGVPLFLFHIKRQVESWKPGIDESDPQQLPQYHS